MNALLHNNYLQIILRCIAVYLFVIIAIRIFGKKELAQLTVVDLVFILLISNSVQNAMVGQNNTLQGKAILLIYKGKLQHHNLEQAEITIDEIQAAVREHGVEDVQHVDLAMLEVDGSISVISDDFKNKSVHPPSHKRRHRFKGKIK